MRRKFAPIALLAAFIHIPSVRMNHNPWKPRLSSSYTVPLGEFPNFSYGSKKNGEAAKGRIIDDL